MPTSNSRLPYLSLQKIVWVRLSTYSDRIANQVIDTIVSSQPGNASQGVIERELRQEMLLDLRFFFPRLSESVLRDWIDWIAEHYTSGNYAAHGDTYLEYREEVFEDYVAKIRENYLSYQLHELSQVAEHAIHYLLED